MKRLLPSLGSQHVRSSGAPSGGSTGSGAATQQSKGWTAAIAAIALFLVAFSAGHLFGVSRSRSNSSSSLLGALPENSLLAENVAPSCVMTETGTIDLTSPPTGHNNNSVVLRMFVQSTTTPTTELALATWLRPAFLHSQAISTFAPSLISAVILPSSEVARSSITRAVQAVLDYAKSNVTSLTTTPLPIIDVAKEDNILPTTTTSSSSQTFLSVGVEVADSEGEESSTVSPAINGRDRRAIVNMVAQHICPELLEATTRHAAKGGVDEMNNNSHEASSVELVLVFARYSACIDPGCPTDCSSCYQCCGQTTCFSAEWPIEQLRYICPELLEATTRHASNGGGADEMNNNRTKLIASSWYLYSRDTALVSIPAVLRIARRAISAAAKQPAIVLSGPSSSSGDASVSQWISAKLRRRSIATDGSQSEVNPARFFLISDLAAQQLCSTLTRHHHPIKTSVSTVPSSSSACVRRFASIYQFIPSTECFHELGIATVAHQGIVGQKKKGTSLRHDAVSNIVAINDMDVSHWAYYHYFLNVFRHL
ncbi:membrane-associated protein, putative [Bodo saltans]|uniref:Membrane-associated protein, putative n=1 Tax=Bodo saltans TaxID=75058 RepID=A0A0S4J0Z1_BODSA|nr:membrane-associated protein, putative [Bodo saltans]|eukprot:CUG50568.1 membrane-associated protein, putative [Bodo saltans]